MTTTPARLGAPPARRVGEDRLARVPEPAVDVSPYFDLDRGLVDRTIFSDQAVYRQELRRVFAPSWLFLAHESQFTKPGDFFTTYMGEDPVIVTMGKDRKLRAFLNACRHRGMRVCRADAGATKAFTCSYHGWSYDTSGKLINVPNGGDYPAHFEQDQWGLIEVAQLDTYKGLVFATWNPEAPPLVEALGGLTWYLDAMLDHDPEGTEAVGGVHKWVLEGNWKLAAEQFASDWYHVNISHASALMVMSPTGKGPKTEIVQTPGRQYTDSLGHGHGFPTHPKSRFDDRVVHEWTDYEALRERLGDARVEGPMTTGHGTVFPNFSYLPVNGSIRVWHPKGPDKMEVWAWTIVDKSMPDEVKDAQRIYNLRTFGPSGIFEQDDGENWSECQATAHGFVAGSMTLNYQMGLGLQSEDGVHPGTTGRLYSDGAARGFYTRWRDLMNTPAWHENNAGKNPEQNPQKNPEDTP